MEPAVLRKLLSKTRPGTPLPRPRPPKKNIHSLPENASSSNLHLQCAAPGIDSLDRPIRKSLHWTSCKGFTPKTRKRLRADAVKSTHLKPSCHQTGTTTAPRSTPECDLPYQRCLRTTKSHLKTSRSIIPPPSAMRSRARAMGQGFRLLAPVRGLIRPSIPLPFHWRPETRSQAFSPRAMDFFFFSFLFFSIFFSFRV